MSDGFSICALLEQVTVRALLCSMKLHVGFVEEMTITCFCFFCGA
jgi:hypothetical protein